MTRRGGQNFRNRLGQNFWNPHPRIRWRNLPLEAAAIRGGDRSLRPSSPLRYRAAMRKTTAKFALHKETIRELSRMELSRAAGGGDTDTLADAVRQTRDKECVAADAAGG